LGVADDTLVMFSSDNGPEVSTVVNMRKDHAHDGARPWRGMKRDQWEGGHRVPLIARWPGRIAAGSTTDETVCLTDVMATCAAIVGAELPNDAAEDSYDFLPVLLGRQGDEPVRRYTLHQTISLALAIRRGPWKYLDHRGSGGNNYRSDQLRPFALPEKAPDAPGQLYNLDCDPGETDNLYFEHPEIVQELRSQLELYKQGGRSAPPRPPSSGVSRDRQSGPSPVRGSGASADGFQPCRVLSRPVASVYLHGASIGWHRERSPRANPPAPGNSNSH
jgi:arylsulfatase A-like enzyme